MQERPDRHAHSAIAELGGTIASMKLSGIQKLTLLDFPGRTAATVFTPGCNFRCPFCHNADLVLGERSVTTCAPGSGNGVATEPTSVPASEKDEKPPMPASEKAEVPLAGAGPDAAGLFPAYELEDFFSFLDKRKGLLDGVCVTGGEPLLQPGLADFCAHVRERGFAVKLDTNGSFPDRLRALVSQGLVDYVAMDVKSAPERYEETVGVDGLDLARVRESVSFLLEGSVPYEFRTTVVRELHAESDLRSLAEWIAGAEAWFLQSFIDEESVLGGTGRFHAWEPDELRHILPELQRIVPTAALRGIDP